MLLHGVVVEVAHVVRRLVYRPDRVPLEGLSAAFDARCRNSYETAEFLDVSEDTLLEALELYREAYGPVAVAGDFVIRFEPRLSVYRVIMIA